MIINCEEWVTFENACRIGLNLFHQASFFCLQRRSSKVCCRRQMQRICILRHQAHTFLQASTAPCPRHLSETPSDFSTKCTEAIEELRKCNGKAVGHKWRLYSDFKQNCQSCKAAPAFHGSGGLPLVVDCTKVFEVTSR